MADRSWSARWQSPCRGEPFRPPPDTWCAVTTPRTFTVEYLEPEIEAEPLPDEFSPSNLRRSLVIIGVIALVTVALIVLVPGLASLRERFSGAQPGWLVLAAVLQLGSCAGYVLVFRGVFCRRMSWR